MSRILLFLFIFPTYVFAYQIAYIKDSRALVYADEELRVPIGYLSKGKKVQVGDVKRYKGQSLPTVLSGKVVYLKVDDLAFKDEKTDKYIASGTEHFIEEEKEEKDILEPIRLVVNLDFMDPGSQWNQLMDLTGDPQNPMVQLEGLLELRLVESHFFFDAGFILSTLQGGTYSFEALGFKGLVQYKIFDFEFLDLDLNAGFHFAPGGAKLKYNGVYDNGNYFGYIFGGQARFMPKSTWNLNLGVAYNIIGLNELNDIPLSNGEFVLNKFEGWAIYFGFSFPL
jgi:hypothetical protein